MDIMKTPPSSPEDDGRRQSHVDVGHVSSSSVDKIILVSQNIAIDVGTNVEDNAMSRLEDETAAFYYFMNLPDPIRKRIWALNLPTPRLVEVIFHKGEEGWYTNAPIIANLSVCRESRLEALKTHPLSFACYESRGMIPFNFSQDTLLLGRSMHNRQAFFKKQCTRGDLEKVQSLMVDASLDWGSHNTGRGYGNLGHISHLIFKGLQTHIILYSSTVDLFPPWVKPHWFPNLYRVRWHNIDPVRAVAKVKRVWPSLTGLYYLTPEEAENGRYSRYPESEERDPAIRLWTMPTIFTLGVMPGVIDGFSDSFGPTWADLVVDRTIEDVFATPFPFP